MQRLTLAAQALLRCNAKVYLACRTRSKAEQAIRELHVDYPNNTALYLELDLASLKSVRKAAEEFLRLVAIIVTWCYDPAHSL